LRRARRRLANYGYRNAHDIDKTQGTQHSSAPFFESEETKTVANSPQARKRARQADHRRMANGSMRSLYRTCVKKVLRALEAKDASGAIASYRAAVPVIDRMANKGIIHKNKAARHKSRLNARIRALDAATG
jgi:small subunit ribosomal protein S20